MISTNFPWKWYLKDLEGRKKNGCRVFSCFSCGGGSSMGYKLAGYEVVGCCEIDPQMMKMYIKNHHPKYPFLMDIRDFLELPDEKIPDEIRGVDILDGSPPCSVFSTAGDREKGWGIEKQFREGQAKQRLDDLFLYFVKVADRLKPKVVVAENVKGILLKNARGWMNKIVKAFDEAGYLLQIFLLDASKMGVPQRRERVFFIAHRKDLAYGKLVLSFDEKPITFGEVREEKGDPWNPESERDMLMKYRLPSDKDVSDINMRITRKKAAFTCKINADDKAAFTIASGGKYYRMSDGLVMTDRDIINCQTFPQDYDFFGKRVQYVCGMSVPPVMMAKIAEQVYLQWLRKKD